MEKAIMALQKMVPKEMGVLRRRFHVLKGVQMFGPIGRRSLSEKLAITEKIIRNEIDFFTEAGYVEKTAVGVELSKMGQDLVNDVEGFMKQLEGLDSMATQVKDVLGCKKVLIVSGDSDINEETRSSMGKRASEVLIEQIQGHQVIALTGGSTIYQMVHEMKPKDLSNQEITIVPARGSLGHQIIHQANSLVAKLGDKLQVQYRLLNIPDNLSEQALSSVRQEPEIYDAIDLLMHTNILVFGIATCDAMIQRRNLKGDVKDLLQERHAVAEALGHYFNMAGEVVYTSRSIGISIEEMQHLQVPMALAGGSSKGEAVYAVRHFLKNAIVLIDEGAARQVLNCHIEAPSRNYS